MEIGLVSCTKSKREQAAKPADLYMESAFFRRAGSEQPGQPRAV